MTTDRQRLSIRNDKLFLSLMWDLLTLVIAVSVLYVLTITGMGRYYNMDIDIYSAMTVLAGFVFGRSLIMAGGRWVKYLFSDIPT